jgi:hypothetical protein
MWRFCPGDSGRYNRVDSQLPKDTDHSDDGTLGLGGAREVQVHGTAGQ